jgi:hydroxypyruvate isomerase
MDRRSLLIHGASLGAIGLGANGLASGALGSQGAAGAAPTSAGNAPNRERFKLGFAPHFGQFAALCRDDLVAQLEWIADQGFSAIEDNGMAGRSEGDQKRIAVAMERLGLQMGVFVANFGTAFGKRSFASAAPEYVQSFLADLNQAVEIAKRINAKWMTIVLGDRDPGLELDYQHANAIEMLKRGAEVFEPHGLVMVMEPLNPWRDHAGMLLTKAAQAHMLCKAVGSPAVKILFDIYHQQISEGNLIPNIDHCWDEIAYFQIGDNPGRNEPGSGEINYTNVMRHIQGRGFTGILGMEHGQARGGAEGQAAVLAAYRELNARL